MKEKKRLLPSLIATTILWLSLIFIIYFLDPNTFAIVPIFFLVLFLTLLFTFSLIFANTRRGLTLSLAIILFLVLKIFGIGNIINLFLIAAIVITIEVYFWYTKSP